MQHVSMSYIFFLLRLGSNGCSIFPSHECWKFSWVFDTHSPHSVLFKFPVYSQLICCLSVLPELRMTLHFLKKVRRLASYKQVRNYNYEQENVFRVFYPASSLCNYGPTAVLTSILTTARLASTGKREWEKGVTRESPSIYSHSDKRGLQSHPLWGMLEFLVIPALQLIACIWLECIFQESIQFGFEDIKG